MRAIRDSKAFAIFVLVLALIVLWYVGAVLLNWGVVTDRLSRDEGTHSFADIVLTTLSYTRPVLPAPHQVAVDLWNTTLTLAPSSKRSLLYHAWVTLSATLLGFVMGTVLGVALALFIVLNQAASRSGRLRLSSFSSARSRACCTTSSARSAEPVRAVTQRTCAGRSAASSSRSSVCISGLGAVALGRALTVRPTFADLAAAAAAFDGGGSAIAAVTTFFGHIRLLNSGIGLCPSPV